MMIEPARVLGNRPILAPPRPKQIDELGKRRKHIDETQARHGAAHVEVGEECVQTRDRL
jgi:hypothetical protein